MTAADALQVVQYDQVSRTPLSVQTIDERQISERLPGNPLRPRTLSTPLSGSPACSEVRAYGGLMTTASMEGGRRSWPILGHRTIWRRRTFLFPQPFPEPQGPSPDTPAHLDAAGLPVHHDGGHTCWEGPWEGVENEVSTRADEDEPYKLLDRIQVSLGRVSDDLSGAEPLVRPGGRSYRHLDPLGFRKRSVSATVPEVETTYPGARYVSGVNDTHQQTYL